MRLRSWTDANSTVSRPRDLPEADLDPGLEPVRQPRREVVERLVASHPRAVLHDGGRLGVPTERDDLLDRTHRQTLGDDPLREPLDARPPSLQPEQRTGVPGGQHAGRDPALHQRRQLQQAQRVRDLRARPLDPRRQLLVRAAEVVEQLLVGRGLLERVQLRSGAGSPGARRAAGRRRRCPG